MYSGGITKMHEYIMIIEQNVKLEYIMQRTTL